MMKKIKMRKRSKMEMKRRRVKDNLKIIKNLKMTKKKIMNQTNKTQQIITNLRIKTKQTLFNFREKVNSLPTGRTTMKMILMDWNKVNSDRIRNKNYIRSMRITMMMEVSVVHSR